MSVSWKGRFRRGMTLGVFLFGQICWGQGSLVDIWDNNSAVEMQMDEKATQSFDAFATLLGKDPFHPVFQYNMGTGFIVTEDVEKAKQLFQEMADQEQLPLPLKFGTHFNLGVLKSAEKDVDMALEHYQAALAVDPNNVQVKTNIELLVQQKKGGGKGDKKNKDKGKGDSKKSDKPQDDEGKDGDEEKQPQKMKNQNPGYKGKDMSKEDVKKILKELKNQEQKIRAKHDRKGKKEKDRGKNW